MNGTTLSRLLLSLLLALTLSSRSASAIDCGVDPPTISATATAADPITGALSVTLTYTGAERVGWEWEGRGYSLERSSLPPSPMIIVRPCTTLPVREAG